MYHFENMIDKKGFDDGDNIPIEADSLRMIYITAMNALLNRFGSKLCLVAFTGINNPCMILATIVDKPVNSRLYTIGPSHSYICVDTDEAGKCISLREGWMLDDAFRKAFEIASNLLLDDLVSIQVTVDEPNFNDLLDRIKIGDFDPKETNG
jgi:hypothetical protein